MEYLNIDLNFIDFLGRQGSFNP